MIHHNNLKTQIDHARKAGLSTREFYAALLGTRHEERAQSGRPPIDGNGFIASVDRDGKVSYQSSGDK